MKGFKELNILDKICAVIILLLSTILCGGLFIFMFYAMWVYCHPLVAIGAYLFAFAMAYFTRNSQIHPR